MTNPNEPQFPDYQLDPSQFDDEEFINYSATLGNYNSEDMTQEDEGSGQLGETVLGNRSAEDTSLSAIRPHKRARHN